MAAMDNAAAASSGQFSSMVLFGKRKRLVSYSPSTDSRAKFLQGILAQFNDVDELKDATPSELLLQIKSEEWGGEFIDVLDDKVIPDHSTLQISRLRRPEKQNKVC